MAWYAGQKREILSRDGTNDALFEQYPSSDTEALQARSQDKRFAPEIIALVSHEAKQVADLNAPQITGLRLYQLPQHGRKYGIGADASGGKTDGDPAVACVVDAETNEQGAVLEEKVEADVFGGRVAGLAKFFDNAAGPAG